MMNCQGKSSIVLTKAKQWFGIFWHFPQLFIILYITLKAMHLTYFGLNVVNRTKQILNFPKIFKVHICFMIRVDTWVQRFLRLD